MRIFFLGAPASIPSGLPDDPMNKLRRTGNNTGNLLIGHAVHRQLDYSASSGDMGLPAEEIRQRFDLIVIPASNFIHSGFDFQYLADFLEAVPLPCVMIGVGAQAKDFSTTEIPLKPGTLRFLQIVSERSHSIGARGCFTADVLNGLGIKNVCVTGCPSIYWNPKRNLTITKTKSYDELCIGVNCSRNVAQHAINPEQLRHVEGQLIRDAAAHGASFIAQSEVEEISIIYQTADEHMERRVKEYYAPYVNTSDSIDFFKHGGRVFFDIGEWQSFIQDHDFVCGSRLHGCMIALQNEMPAFIVAHDTRTMELCNFIGVPHLKIGAALNQFSLKDCYESADYSAFVNRRAELYDSYISFLASNGLKHKLGGSASTAESCTDTNVTGSEFDDDISTRVSFRRLKRELASERAKRRRLQFELAGVRRRLQAGDEKSVAEELAYIRSRLDEALIALRARGGRPGYKLVAGWRKWVPRSIRKTVSLNGLRRAWGRSQPS